LLTGLVGGPRTPVQLFVANQALEAAIFLGDAWCFCSPRARSGRIPGDRRRRPMPVPPPRGDRGPFVSTLVELTPAGRRLVSGP